MWLSAQLRGEDFHRLISMTSCPPTFCLRLILASFAPPLLPPPRRNSNKHRLMSGTSYAPRAPSRTAILRQQPRIRRATTKTSLQQRCHRTAIGKTVVWWCHGGLCQCLSAAVDNRSISQPFCLGQKATLRQSRKHRSSIYRDGSPDGAMVMDRRLKLYLRQPVAH